MNRRRMIRRGATYGPHLPEGAPDDGVERGIAAFVICASLIRQFEFAQNVWVNDGTFTSLATSATRSSAAITTERWNSRSRSGPFARKSSACLRSPPSAGGAYFFLPGLAALSYLASLDAQLRTRIVASTKENPCQRQLPPGPTIRITFARKYTPGKRRMSIYWTWSYPWEAQRDPAAMENRFSTMTEVRNVLWPAYETPEWSAAQFLQGIAGTLELFHARP